MTQIEDKKNGSDTEVPDPGTFELDHFQPVKLILFPKIFNLPDLYNGGSLSLLPQIEGKEGAGGWK